MVRLGSVEKIVDIGRFTEKISKIAKIGGKIREASMIDSLITVLKTQMSDIIEKTTKMIANRKAAKRLKSAEEKIEEGEKSVKKAGKLKKISKTAGKIVGVGATLGAGAYFYHETSDTYEEAKLKCQETCQGFNNVNLSKHKYDQIVNLLYCRDPDDHSKPCSTYDGGGNPRGKIILNECPSPCTDIRGPQTDEQIEQDTHINSMLYGSCNIKDGDHFYCDYPQYKNSGGSQSDFGKIPLDRYTVDDNYKPKNDLDKQFRDPWHAYPAMKAAGIIEATAAGGAVGEMGSMMTNFPGSNILPLAGGAAGLATSNALIPDDFPGHCLHKLFEHYTNEDPNIFVSPSSRGHSDSDGKGNIVDYKYIRKCKGDENTDFGPDSNGVKKCILATGEVISGDQNTDTDVYGTCVAWKKTPPDGQGKCLPTMHSSSIGGAATDLVTLNVGQSVQGDASECLNINNGSDCNNHEYCYWVQDGNVENPHLDNIYFCLNDKSLIDIHNGILDNDEDAYLINQLHGQSSDIEGRIDESVDYSIKNFNKYSGGEGDSKQEIDIGDICNNYCNNYLCHEPYISMSLIPGINNAEDLLKMIINIIIKYIFSFGFILPMTILYLYSKNDGNTSFLQDDKKSFASRTFWHKLLFVMRFIKISIKSIFYSLIIACILTFILTVIPGLSDKVNEKIEPYSEDLLEYILQNEKLLSIFENESFLGIF